MVAPVGTLPSIRCEARHYKKGPFCTDERRESHEGEKEDCFTRAKFNLQAQALTCIQNIGIDWIFHGDVSYGEGACPEMACVNHIPCYLSNSYTARFSGENCYCLSPTIICKYCDTDDSPKDVGKYNESQKRLQPLSLTASAYDIPIPIIFGRVFVGGNVLWAGNSRVETVVTKTAVGLDISVETVETGYIDLAVGLCKGPIDRVTRIWLDDALIYDDQSMGFGERAAIDPSFANAGLRITVQSGGEDQEPFHSHARSTGFDRTPAYRDIAVLYLENFPIPAGRGGFPRLRVEVVRADFETPQGGVYVESSITSISDITYDEVGDRIFAVSGHDLHVLDGELTLQESHTFPEPIVKNSLTISDEGHIVFLSGDRLFFLWGANRYEQFYTFDNVPLPEDVVGVRAMGYMEPPGGSYDVYTVICILTKKDILYYRVNFFVGDITFLHKHTLLGSEQSFVKLLSGDFSKKEYVGETKMFRAVALGEGELRIFDIRVFDSGMDVYLRTDVTPISMDYTLSIYDVYSQTPEMIDAFMTSERELMVIVNDAGRTKILKFVTEIVPEYAGTYLLDIDLSPIDVTTRLAGSNLRIIDGYRVYELDTENLTVYADPEAPSPTSSGKQFYDSIRRSITYLSETGSVVKLFPTTTSNPPVDGGYTSAGAILRGTLNAIGLYSDKIDITEVLPLRVDGYIIEGQGSATDVINDLREFFHIVVLEQDGKIVARPISNAHVLAVDSHTEGVDESLTRGVDRSDIRSVSITYYDVDALGETLTQTVTKEMFGEYEEYTESTQDVTYSPSLFTNGTRVIQAAEISLLKNLQRGDTWEVYVKPGRLEIQPGDYIGEFRVEKVEMDTSFVSKISGVMDDRSKYLDTITLPGVLPDIIDNTLYSYDVPTKIFPVITPFGPIWEKPHEEIVFAGWASPSEGDSNRTPLYAIPGRPTDAPERPVIIGRVISLPENRHNTFTTDKVSRLRIRFQHPVSVGDLDNLSTNDDILSSYDKNLLFVGKEMIQYQNYDQEDPYTIVFYNLLRGRFDTDRHTNSHELYELAYIYTPDTLVPIPVDDTQALFQTARVTTYDERSPYRFRESTAHIGQSRLITRWDITNARMAKIDDFVAYVMIHPRNAYENTFTDEREEPAYLDRYLPTIYFIKREFDSEEFLDRYSEGGFADIMEQTVSTNSYINRFDPRSANSTVLGEGIQYATYEMDMDEIEFDDDLYIALTTVDSRGRILGEIRGVSFPKRVNNYKDKYSSGILIRK